MSKGRVDPETNLTPRQRAFAEAYARCGVGAQAAREAGYSEKRADQQAFQLLADPNVQAYITQLQQAASVKAGVDIKRVVDELCLIAFADLTDFVEWGPDGVTLRNSAGLDALKRRAVVEVSQSRTGGLKIKLADKIAALDKLGRYTGMFADGNGDEEAPPPVSVTVNVVDASVPRADA